MFDYNINHYEKNELEEIRNTTINKMWISELNILREQYLEYKAERVKLMSGEEKKKIVSKTGVVKNSKKH